MKVAQGQPQGPGRMADRPKVGRSAWQQGFEPSADSSPGVRAWRASKTEAWSAKSTPRASASAPYGSDISDLCATAFGFRPRFIPSVSSAGDGSCDESVKRQIGRA